MWIQRLLRVFNFKLLPHGKEKQMEREESLVAHQDGRGEVDWLSERPENWYYGPLEFFTQVEEGPDQESTF